MFPYPVGSPVRIDNTQASIRLPLGFTSLVRRFWALDFSADFFYRMREGIGRRGRNVRYV